MAALGAFLTGLLTQAQVALTPVAILAGLLIGGLVWATGNPQGGRSWITGAFIGGAVMLLAATIVAGIAAIGRA